jgi:hypothetical protein
MAGDDYQHLYTWLHALHLLRDSEGVTRVEFEVATPAMSTTSSFTGAISRLCTTRSSL